MKKIKELIQKYWISYKEVICYLFFGVLTTIVNFISYYILIFLVGGEEGAKGVISNILATILAILFAYLTNKIFVFNSKTENKKEMVKEMGSFFLCRAFSLVVDNGIYFIGCTILKMPSLLIKTMGQVIVVVLNYVFSKLFIFKKKEENN